MTWEIENESRMSVLDIDDPLETSEPAGETEPFVLRGWHDDVINHISSGLCARVARTNRQELERVGRKVQAANQFQEMLESLKGGIARRAELRSGSQARLERPSEAA